MNLLFTASMDDLIALVDSGSLTTYKIPLSYLNQLWSVSGSASVASVSTNALSSSYSISSSYSFTSSYSISSSRAITSSYSVLSTTSSYSINSSTSVSSSYSLSSSRSENCNSSSYSITSSHALYSVSSSYAITSSNSITASYALSISPTITTGVGFSVRGLLISGSGQKSHVEFTEVVLHSAAGSTTRLSNSSPIKLNADRGVVGAGGYDNNYSAATNSWYDLWVIYNSSTQASSSILVPQGIGAPPRTNDPIWPAANSYDYQSYVGSVLCDRTSPNNFGDVIEYGVSRIYKSSWRSLPTSYGTSNGITFNHSCSAYPSDSTVLYQCITSQLGYSVGDIIPESSVMCHYRDDDWDYWHHGFSTVVSNSGSINFFRVNPGGGAIYVPNKTTGATNDTMSLSYWSASIKLTF